MKIRTLTTTALISILVSMPYAASAESIVGAINGTIGAIPARFLYPNGLEAQRGALLNQIGKKLNPAATQPTPKQSVTAQPAF